MIQFKPKGICNPSFCEQGRFHAGEFQTPYFPYLDFKQVMSSLYKEGILCKFLVYNMETRAPDHLKTEGQGADASRLIFIQYTVLRFHLSTYRNYSNVHFPIEKNSRQIFETLPTLPSSMATIPYVSHQKL